MATATEAPASITAEGPTSHTQNQLDALAKLRVEFPSNHVQALPKILCKACSESRTKVCDNPKHTKSKCKVCDNYITQAHLHLDYVGHAELTHRLLDVDPLWDWEPLALAPNGLPQFDENGGLWIRLTVCGKTRLGYGDAQGKRGPNAVKEAIGDALRNAAMRFGAALNLWAKSDLTEAQTEHPKSQDEDYAPAARPAKQEATEQPPTAGVSQEKAGHVDRLMGQVRDCWNNGLVLAQIRGDAETHGVIDAQVQGPDGAWLTFRRLLNNRIAELQAAQGGDTGQVAA